MFKFALAKTISSTQIELIAAIKKGFNENSFAIAALMQTNGIGSNNRAWNSEGNFVIPNSNSSVKNDDFSNVDFVFYDDYSKFNLDIKNNLYISFYSDNIPSDLPIQSASIYYSMIMKLVLQENNSKVFIKWPNDFYIANKKIGGLITSKVKDKLVCGLGLNITNAPNEAMVLDINISYSNLLKAFFDKISYGYSWKEIFEYYKRDFELSRAFYFKSDEGVYSLEDAKLYEDGSILVDNKRIYSLR